MTQLGKPYSELPHTGLGASLQHPVCQGMEGAWAPG